MDAETSKYILENFYELLTLNEKAILKYQYFLTTSIDEYKTKLAEQLVSEKTEQIIFNNCPKCGKLARTLYAKQCRYCGHDWH